MDLALLAFVFVAATALIAVIVATALIAAIVAIALIAATLLLLPSPSPRAICLREEPPYRSRQTNLHLRECD